jgi:aspartate aminotransferase
VSFEKPQGTFYFFVDCSKLIGTRTEEGAVIVSDAALAVYLLDRGVAIVPGSAFLASPYFRLSFATDDATLIEGCRRIRLALAALH